MLAQNALFDPINDYTIRTKLPFQKSNYWLLKYVLW